MNYAIIIQEYSEEGCDEMRLTDEKLARTLKIMGIVTLSLISIFILSQFQGVIGSLKAGVQSVAVPFLIAFFINFLLYPIVIYLEEKGVRPRWVIVSLLFVVIFGIIIGLLMWVMPTIIAQLTKLLTTNLDSLFASLMKTLEELNFSPNLIDSISKELQGFDDESTTELIKNLTRSIPKMFDILMTTILIPIILFFMLKDHSNVGEGLYKSVPVRFRDHFAILTKRINETIGLYLRGQFIIMIGIGTIATIGYSLIGLDYAIVFGVIVGLTNIIPYIGATIAAIIPVAYALLANDAGAPSWWLVLALNLSFQFIEGNILQPVIMSKQLNMHPLLIIAAILFFGSTLGIIGVIFATPIAGIIKVFINYVQEVREAKENSELEGNLQL